MLLLKCPPQVPELWDTWLDYILPSARGSRKPMDVG